MTTIVLISYFILLAFIAFRSYLNVSNFSDFFIAHKKGTFVAVTGSLIATILGGSAVIGAIDAGRTMGWATSWYMLCASIGLLALLPLTKRISKIGRFTLPDLLEDLYGKQAKKIASFVIPVAWLGIIAAQLIAAARILQSFAGIEYTTGVLLSGFVFTAYTIAGGQISILKTDFVQSILIIAGLMLLVIFSFWHLPVEEVKSFPLKLPFNVHFKPIDLFILLMTYSTTFTAGPDIYSRIFCASDEKIARKAILTTELGLIPVALMIGYLGVLGAVLNGTESPGATLVEISQTVLPVWVIPVIVVALLSAVLSSADTTILSASIIIADRIEKSKFGINTLKTTRLIILFVGILSMFIAIQFTSIIGMLLLALTVYSGAFILPILLGLSGIHSHPKYVSAAIISGGLTALIGKLLLGTRGESWSNGIIIGAFAINALLLLLGRKKCHLKNRRHLTPKT